MKISPSRRGLPILERMARYTSPPNESGCELWTGSQAGIGYKTGRGYGSIRINGRNEKAHREKWRQLRGSIPDGLCVCHTCDVPSCVAIDHLFLGTPMDNAKDRDAKGRGNSRWPSGERSGSAKLTVAIVHEIMASVETHTELGKKYGVDLGSIHAVRSGRSWRHVTGLPPYAKGVFKWPRSGPGNCKTKLTKIMVHEIMESAEPSTVLGRKFGVNQSCIAKVRSGESWTHVTGLPKRRQKSSRKTIAAVGVSTASEQ